MKQVFQSLEDGTTSVIDVPAPRVAPGHVLIRTQASIVSAGTERMLVDFGRANMLAKARQQPERVTEVLAKVRTDGLAPTIDAVRSKLSRPITLGYANAGVVVAVGAGVTDLEPGEAVASNGPHAEVVAVPRNLVVRTPERDGRPLPAEEAAFAPIGAIALQGVRLAAPTIGERFVVTGLGLIGLLTVQLLRANGCQVLGLDFDTQRLELARRLGAQTVELASGADPVDAAGAFAHGRGVDGVIITASTPSNEPVHQAATMCRKRGRIVLVGVTGLELQRADFYEKELSFQVSCSYGPGRYDAEYEEKGHDYPLGFVRWSSGRNFEAVLDLVAAGQLDVASLISHRWQEAEAPEAYRALSEDPTVLGIALDYPSADEVTADRLLVREVRAQRAPKATSSPRIAVLGAGNYTQQTLLPALARTPAQLAAIVSHGGATAAQAARKFGFARASTDADQVLEDPSIDAVFITTRHDTHAAFARRALEAGKHVFLEKPLAITEAELADLAALVASARAGGTEPPLTVGFNRRFAPGVIDLQNALRSLAGPVSLVATINAGAIPADHWTQDPHVGGGRIVGEACHFIDVLRHLAGHPLAGISSEVMASATRDTATITVRTEDGSIGTVHYFANGARSFPKERYTASGGGRVFELDNFRSLRSYGPGRPRTTRYRGHDKGHAALIAAFVDHAAGRGPAPIALDEILEVSGAALEAAAL